MRGRAGIAIILAAAAIAGPVGIATPAYAHNVLIDSTPAAGETLTELPEAFSITTNEDLLALQGSKGFVLQIRDAAGLYYGDGCVQVVDASMSATPALGAPGAYTMLWQAVSADGHSVNGEIPFTWAPAGDATPSNGFAAPPVCGESSTPAPTETPLSFTPAPATPAASGADLATVLWIGGALLAIGVAVAVAIALAGRRRA